MKIRLTTWDAKWSKLVRQRDGDTCQVCGNYGYQNAHHILSRSIKPLRFEPFNGISLCVSCHVFNHNFSAHKTPEAFKRWFKKKFPERWKFISKKRQTHMSERDAVKEFQELLKSQYI